MNYFKFIGECLGRCEFLCKNRFYIVNYLRGTSLVPLRKAIASHSWQMSIPKGPDERGSWLFIPTQQESILAAASMLLRCPQGPLCQER